MSTLNDYRILMPGEVQYLVVGCLPALLSSLMAKPGEPRELSISKLFSFRIHNFVFDNLSSVGE